MTILLNDATLWGAEPGADRGETRDVLIDDGTITQIGTAISSPGATEVDCSRMLVTPGFVDTHTHFWQSLFPSRASDAWGMEFWGIMLPLASWLTPDDVYAATRYGAAQSMRNGVTTVFDYCHCIISPEHADAAVRALEDSGINAVFGYDLQGNDPAKRGSLGPSSARFDDLARVVADLRGRASDIAIAACLSNLGVIPFDETIAEIQFVRSLGLMMSFHNNEPDEIVALDRQGHFAADILPVHSNFVTDADLDVMQRCGSVLSTQPEVEMASGRRPLEMVKAAHARGIPVSLGTDCPAMVNLGMLPQLRTLYTLQRVMDGAKERHTGRFPVQRRPGLPTFAAHDLMRCGTANGAQALGLGRTTGVIAVGRRADLVLFDFSETGMSRDNLAANVVLNANESMINAVMVKGKFVKRDGRMVNQDLAAIETDRMSAERRVLGRMS